MESTMLILLALVTGPKTYDDIRYTLMDVTNRYHGCGVFVFDFARVRGWGWIVEHPNGQVELTDKGRSVLTHHPLLRFIAIQTAQLAA